MGHGVLQRGRLRGLICTVLTSLCLLPTTSVAEDRGLAALAAEQDEARALALLADQGEAIDRPVSDGTTALMYAAHYGLQALAEALIAAGAALDERNDYGASALAEAIIMGQDGIALALLEAGADPNLGNHEGETPLMVAARSGNLAVAEALLKAGAEVNAREQWGGQTALMWAAAQRQPAMLERLLQHGADPNLHATPRLWDRRITSEPRPKDMNKGGFSALQYAARQGCVACIPVLARGGANLDGVDPDRVTALNLALLNLHFDTAAALIEAGADVNAWDLFGRSPLYNAIDLNRVPSGGRKDIPSLDSHSGHDIARLLLERGANPDLQLKLAPPFRNAVFDRGSDKELTTGATPLLVAARTGDLASLRLLLEYGARVDLPNKYGQTPWLVAAGVDYASSPTRGRFKTEDETLAILQALLAAGADPAARSGDPTLRPDGRAVPRVDRYRQMHPANQGPEVVEGKNALHGAARLGWNKVLRYLLEQGVPQQVKDASGRTPIDYAMGRYPPAYNDAPPIPMPETARLLQQSCEATPGCEPDADADF